MLHILTSTMLGSALYIGGGAGLLLLIVVIVLLVR